RRKRRKRKDCEGLMNGAERGRSCEKLSGVDHVEEFRFNLDAGSFRKRAQFTDELQLAGIQPFELAEHIGFHLAAEELGGGDVVDGEQREELRQLYGRD